MFRNFVARSMNMEFKIHDSIIYGMFTNYVSLRQGRETYCFSPCVCPSVRPSVRHKSCPLYNLKTVQDFSMKLGTLVNHDETLA